MSGAPEDDDTPIPAATVLLLRDTNGGADPLEVLMVERHADIGFAGGALVFPGGRIDPGDHNPLWAEHADGLPDDPALAAAMVAAAREAFEEAGILLARDARNIVTNDVTSALNDRRAAIEADDALFLQMIREEKLRLACDQMVLFARWVAPPRLHKRFDTWFFAAATPPGQEAREDGNEATEAIWITPGDALRARADGSRKLIFPTARNVELLGESKSVNAVFKHAEARVIEPITPDVIMRDGAAYLTIPTDLGYPVTEERLDADQRQ